MRTTALRAAALALMLAVAAGAARAQTPATEATPPADDARTQPANEQVIEPQVQRRDVRIPRIPSNDFSIGGFIGTYSAESFGSSLVTGVRAGYHLTEDIFVEAAYGRSKVSDENFRQVLPGGLFPQPEERLSYFNLSAAVNVLPGEVFFGRNLAVTSAVYVITGIGSTRFADQRLQTVNFGTGLRLFITDRIAAQVDMRDHIYSLDLLGRRQSTHNIEMSAGATFYF